MGKKKFIYNLIKLTPFIVILYSKPQSQINEFFLPINESTIIDSLRSMRNENPDLALRFAFNIIDKFPIGTKDNTILRVNNIIGQI